MICFDGQVVLQIGKFTGLEDELITIRLVLVCQTLT